MSYFYRRPGAHPCHQQRRAPRQLGLVWIAALRLHVPIHSYWKGTNGEHMTHLRPCDGTCAVGL